MVVDGQLRRKVDEQNNAIRFLAGAVILALLMSTAALLLAIVSVAR